MKTLILNGSPRPKGDTKSLINALCSHLPGDVMVIDAYRCDIAACIDCRWCWKHPGCAIKDQMQEVYTYLEDCDNVVIASPIYFSELTGKLLDVASRLQTYFSAGFFRKEEPIKKHKKGAVILTGGGNGRPEKAEETARMLLKLVKADHIHSTVLSYDTDNVPAAEDQAALEGIKKVAEFFCNCQ